MTSKSFATPLANEAVMDLIRLYKVKADVAKGQALAVESDMEAATMVSSFRDGDVECRIPSEPWPLALRRLYLNHTSHRSRRLEKLPPVHWEKSFMALNFGICTNRWMLYLFDASWAFRNGLNAVGRQLCGLPWLVNLITNLKPTYRMHSKRLIDYLVQKTAAARQWAKVRAQMLQSTR